MKLAEQLTPCNCCLGLLALLLASMDAVVLCQAGIIALTQCQYPAYMGVSPTGTTTGAATASTAAAAYHATPLTGK